MNQSNFEQIRHLLLSEKERSVIVRRRHREGMERWKSTLLDTHGFQEAALSAEALDDLYVAESTFVLATLLHMQAYVSDLSIGSSEWKLDDLPRIYGVVDSIYGWVQDAAASDEVRPLIASACATPASTGIDPFKDAFESLVPHDIRHKGGAFLTPAWMADHLLDRLLEGTPWFEKRILEPCAGTGAFVAALVKRLFAAVADAEISASQAINFLSRNFVAVERNPAACLALTANVLSGFAQFEGKKVLASRSRGIAILSDCTDEYFYKNGANGSDVFDELPARRSFDYIVGNPPWISWETLDRSYRERITPIWEKIGLFSGSGSSKSFSKEDISTYITYICIDRFLKDGGILSFILPQGIFQSSLNSRGFRRFSILGPGSFVPLRVKRVDDMTKIPAFRGASTRPAILTLLKGEPTEYPVEYNIYSAKTRGNEIALSVEAQIAEPANAQEPDSAWSIHSRQGGSENLRRISGRCAYRARAGVFTGGANAAYYLDNCESEQGLVKATTVTERAKRKIPTQEILIERDFVFPFVRGRDVSFWHVDADPTRGIILPHTPQTKIAPVGPEVLATQAPRTLAYFNGVRAFLDGRKGLTAMDKANAERGFYTALRVGAYTFAPFKVVWKYIAKEFTPAVIGPSQIAGELKPVIPQEKLMMIDFSLEEEAYFVCGILSSTPFASAIKSRMVSTQISAKIIDSLRVPRYSSTCALHREISDLCKRGHNSIRNESDISGIRKQLDQAVEALLDA